MTAGRILLPLAASAQPRDSFGVLSAVSSALIASSPVESKAARTGPMLVAHWPANTKRSPTNDLISLTNSLSRSSPTTRRYCGTCHDRDHNSGKNIRDEGTRILIAVGHTVGLNGCGASVRPATEAVGDEARISPLPAVGVSRTIDTLAASVELSGDAAQGNNYAYARTIQFISESSHFQSGNDAAGG
jgi:hypothetical protein